MSYHRQTQKCVMVEGRKGRGRWAEGWGTGEVMICACHQLKLSAIIQCASFSRIHDDNYLMISSDAFKRKMMTNVNVKTNVNVN